MKGVNVSVFLYVKFNEDIRDFDREEFVKTLFEEDNLK